MDNVGNMPIARKLLIRTCIICSEKLTGLCREFTEPGTGKDVGVCHDCMKASKVVSW